MLREKENKKFMVLSTLGIIMVVDAHSWSELSLFTNFFPYNSFFMPMFVFISGYFNQIDKNTDLYLYIKRKFVSLFFPFFIISFVAYLVQLIVEMIRNGKILFGIPEMVKALSGILSTGYFVPIAGPMWFVPTLFAVECFYALIKKCILQKMKWNSGIAFLVFTGMNFWVVFDSRRNYGTTNGLLLIYKCMFFLVFMECGLIYKHYLEERLRKVNQLVVLIILLLVNMGRMMVLPRAYDVAFNDIALMKGFTSPYFVTPLISSIAGILFWLTMVELFGEAIYRNKTINYVSQNTFWIMGMHIPLFNILNCVLYIINKKWYALKGFNEEEFQVSFWYRWEEYTQFRFAYFVMGLVGAILTKKLVDLIKELIRSKLNIKQW